MIKSVSKEVAFDYSDFETETVGKLHGIAERVNGHRARVAGELMQIASEVSKAHGVLKAIGRDGQFSAWIRSECHFSHSQAYRFLDIYTAFAGCEDFAQFEDSAVRRLACPSTPQEVLDSAKKIAKRGNFVSLDTVKEMVATWKANNVDEDDEPDTVEVDEEDSEYDEPEMDTRRGDTNAKDEAIAGGDHAGQPRVDKRDAATGMQPARAAPYDFSKWERLVLKVVDAIDEIATELNAGSSDREGAHEFLRDLDVRVCGWSD